MKRIQTIAIALIFSLTILIAGCSGSDEPESAEVQKARAIISTTSTPAEVIGEVNFTQTPEGLQIIAQIDRAPAGKHGFHIHERGSCEDAGKAAGGHFNPDGVKHGYLPDDGFSNAHAGDLGNISIADDGTGELNLTISGLTLDSGQYAIGDRSVILHADEDDFSQPTGNAGGRIGCGAIASL